MSTLGLLVGKVSRTEQTLEALNDALLTLQVDAMDRAAEFGFSSADLDRSRTVLCDFLTAVLQRLEGSPGLPQTRGELGAIVRKVTQGLENLDKPISDWREDLNKILARLRSTRKDTPVDWKPIEAIISAIETDVSGDLRRLRKW